MYQPKTITIKNFGPISSLDYSFDDKVVLLVGQNETDDGQKSNGSGKSYFLEGFCYALLGASFRSVTDSELVRENQESAEIKLKMFDPVTSNKLEISRTVYSGRKSSTVEIKLNGKNPPQATTVLEANKFILATLELSREDILNYFLISKEKYTSFFKSSDGDKKILISRFSRANIVDEAFPKVDADKKLITNQIVEKEKQLLKIEGKIEAFSSRDATEEYETKVRERKEKLEQLETEIYNLTDENKVLENDIQTINVERNKVERELKKIKDVSDIKPQIDIKKVELEKINNSIRELRKAKNELQELLSDTEKSLAGVIECPSCGHNFSLVEGDINVEELEAVKEQLNEEIKITDADIAKANLDVPTINNLIQTLNDEINLVNSKRSEIRIKISNYDGNIQRKTREIDSNLRMGDRLLKEFQELEKKEIEKDDFSKEIKALNKEVKVLNKEIEDLAEQEKEYDLTALQLTSFKNYLANKSLNNITTFTNLYLEKLGSSIRVRFDGFKELKNGKTREKIDTRIFKFGEDKGSFGKLSGGEKARVEVAVILALSGLINSSTMAGLDIIFIDEILESLDVLGLQSILKALKEVNQNVILITQQEMPESDEYAQVKIIKRNGISEMELT